MARILLLDLLEVRLVVPVLALCRHLLHLEALEVQTSGYSTLVLARVWHEPPEGRKFYMKRAIVSMLLVKSWKKCELFFFEKNFSGSLDELKDSGEHLCLE